MSTTVYEVLEELRGAATSEADKGSRLEQLMLSYLRTDPVFAEQFSDVWLWQDWPGRDGKRDTGIDLVAVDKITGGNVAIQCKFYAPTSTIGKADIDSFLSPPGASPSGIDLERLSPDYEYANAYLNAQVWHSDNDKARLYQAASPDQKEHYRKCAEIRVISAINIVAQLRQWILDARADGWDF